MRPLAYYCSIIAFLIFQQKLWRKNVVPTNLKGQKACRFSYFHLTVYYIRGLWGMILYEWAILYFQNCNKHILATRAALFSETQESVRPAQIFQSLPHTFEARRLSAGTKDFSLHPFFPPSQHVTGPMHGLR